MTNEPTGPSAAEVPTCYRHPGRETWIRCQRCLRPICPDCMRDAAVGFQCPQCVERGSKETRQAQGRFGGKRSADPRLTTYVLMGINAVVWLMISATGGAASRLTQLLALMPNGRCGSISQPDQYFPRIVTSADCALVNQGDGLWDPGVATGAWWQLLSSTFTHIELWHIASNMLALYFLGPQLEAVFGRARFLTLYLLSGLAGSVTVMWLSSEMGLTLGASGAIYGLFGALGVVAHKVGSDLRAIFGLLAVNLFITFVIPNISWQGHLGGLVAGLGIAALFVYAPRKRRSTVQWTGMALLGFALLVLTLLRVAALS